MSISFLENLKSTLGPERWYIVAISVSATLSQGQNWLPDIYTIATRDQPSEQRQSIVKRLKETLIKATPLIGVARVIESSLALDAVLSPEDRDVSCFRQDLEFGMPKNTEERGLKGLDRVYRDDIHAIFKKFGDGNKDLIWFSKNVTYGLFLAPCTEDSSDYPLTFQETEILILSCLIAQNAHREVAWHLKGCLRAGLDRGEIEEIHKAAESCIEECKRLAGLGGEKPLARIADIADD